MVKTCFVIAPIGDADSPTRKRSDQILKYVIEPVLGDDWSVERADRISEPGIITNQIIDRLVSVDLVIADLSERNPNVFYELAVRHILRKPYVHLIAHDEDIPFDNAPVRAIKIDVTDLDSVDAAKGELRAQIAHALAAPEVESPISVSLTLSEIRKSGDDESIVASVVLAQMSEIRRQLSQLANSVASIEYASGGGVDAKVLARRNILENALAANSITPAQAFSSNALNSDGSANLAAVNAAMADAVNALAHGGPARRYDRKRANL